MRILLFNNDQHRFFLKRSKKIMFFFRIKENQFSAGDLGIFFMAIVAKQNDNMDKSFKKLTIY